MEVITEATLSPICGGVLTGVTAYVEVWSSNRTENYSKSFTQQLLNLGAKVSKTFNKQVSHVVFKDGNRGTWDKAIKTGVKLVSVLWVEKCRETAAHVDESLFPAINTNEGLPQIIKKKRKCMQPKDFVEKTPENDKRMQRKFDKMSKELEMQKASIDVPVLLFDQDGALMYSPKALAADRSNAMEKRLKEMKNKRECISPTASQMSQLSDFAPLKPSLGCSPSFSRDSSHENGSDDPDNSFEDLCGSQESKRNCSSTSKTRRKHRNQKCIPDSTLEGNNDCVLNSSSKSIYLTPQRTEKFNLPKRLSGDEEKRRSDSLLKNKIHSFLHDIETVDGATENSNALCFTQITKKETTDLYDTPLKNRLFANCEEKRAKRARSSVKSKAFTSISCPSATRNTEQELTKPFTFSHSSDSAEAGSSFEDFFSSITVNRPKMQLSRFSLGALPQNSPSPPSLTSDKKCSSRKSRRSAEDVDAHGSSGNKRRRKTFHFTDNAESRQETAGPKNGDVKHNHLLKSEVAVSESDKSQTSLGICKKPDICLVKGLEKITHLVTCKKALGELELKDTKGDLKEMVLEKTEDPLKIIYKSAESKTSPCDARDGLSKMFNEQRNKCTEESRKKEKTRKSVRSLVMTSMCSEKQNAIIQVVKKFGGFVFSDHVCETTTHVIAGSPRRTLNIILGIARGCWILSYDWVLWSLEHGHWIPEEPYELSDHFPAALICRLQRHLSAGEYQQDLLSSLPTVFISPCSQPPCDKLSEVVQLCGGKVCKAVRQAKICIGEFTGKRPQDALNVSEKWLLDSVTQHKLHPFENYLLN